MNLLRSIARPLLATPFIVAGVDALRHPEQHRARAREIYSLVERFGVQAPDDETTDLITRGTGGAVALAGAALATSKAPRLASLVLGTAPIPIALANNPFWIHKGPQRRADLVNLASALGLVGGALIAATDRVGKPSVAWRVNTWAGDTRVAASKKLTKAQKRAAKKIDAAKSNLPQLGDMK
ncbi:MAG: DoxX family protein [Actinomycetaceae bacterium]|nr:DoxX family protein [Arcanobacterium sp.]MDD7505001.1 DoxX family protein [Actinomycetaceae bacterium]MDY6143342.1 DoxX family protein [Arcanobacterium sp.]